jgi:hypothetical protein
VSTVTSLRARQPRSRPSIPGTSTYLLCTRSVPDLWPSHYLIPRGCFGWGGGYRLVRTAAEESPLNCIYNRRLRMRKVLHPLRPCVLIARCASDNFPIQHTAFADLRFPMICYWSPRATGQFPKEFGVELHLRVHQFTSMLQLLNPLKTKCVCFI